MSVDISIANGRSYIDNNKPEMIEVFTDECMCVWDGKATPTCHYCDGTGQYKMEQYPYEMNIANGNFATLWNSLGLNVGEDSYYGEIDPRAILKALKRTPADLIMRQTIVEGNCYNCGIHEEQANRYISTLQEIALEAEKREEKVIWG